MALVQYAEQRGAPERRRADVERERHQRVELVLVQANVHVAAHSPLSDANVGTQQRSRRCPSDAVRVTMAIVRVAIAAVKQVAVANGAVTGRVVVEVADKSLVTFD